MDQTWNLLQEALTEIEYGREIPPGPRFQLTRQDAENYAVLKIFTWNTDTFNPPNMRHTRHEFVVPMATYNKDTWIRWVFDAILAIETHETCEWFLVNGERIYSPHHGNGEDPYKMWFTSYPEKKTVAPGHENPRVNRWPSTS